ncbi:hypothetical protein OAO58_00985 [bacterium]|nr:hypothetical protein [bacterium]
MKRNQLVKFLAASSLLGASSISATVTSVGVDSTTGPNWRTAANLEPDDEYGTAGYAIFGLNEADSVYNANFDVSEANPANAYNLPAEISISTGDFNIGMWSGNGNFGTMEDPGNGNTLTSAPVLANTGGTKQFTITRAANRAFRITIMVASGDNEGTEYTVAVDDSSGSVNSNYDHVANGLAYHVFDVSEGDSDIQINITSTTQNRSLMGIAFDGGAIDITDPTDSNSNGIGDNWETFYFGSLGAVDPASDEEPDGLTNLEEWQKFTIPNVADTDSDGLEDGEEVDTYSTDPTNKDTDGDGYDDKFEVDNLASDFDPLVDDSSEDPDGDGLDNVAELTNSTNPIDSDSDDDTINDGDEVNGAVNPYSGGTLGAVPGDSTDPNNPDSDGDTISDFAEIDNSNGFITDPNNGDTDGDTVPDDIEMTNSSDPTDSTSFPPVPDSLISVDLQGSNEGAAFPSEPVLMSGFEVRAGIMTDVWNAINIPGHPNTATDPSFDLLDSNGDETGVSLSFTGTISSWSNTPGNDPLTDDYLFVNAGNADFSAAWELSGLSPLSEFTLFTYGGLARDMLLTVDTDGDGDLTNETPTNIDINGFEFTGTVGANGSILGSIDPGASNEANWGGFQLIHAGSSMSGLRVTDIRQTDTGAIELTWTSRPGRSYTVESSLNMVTWTPLLTEIDATPSPGTITTVIVDSPAANEAKKFYRVIRE